MQKFWNRMQIYGGFIGMIFSSGLISYSESPEYRFWGLLGFGSSILWIIACSIESDK